MSCSRSSLVLLLLLLLFFYFVKTHPNNTLFSLFTSTTQRNSMFFFYFNDGNLSVTQDRHLYSNFTLLSCKQSKFLPSPHHSSNSSKVRRCHKSSRRQLHSNILHKTGFQIRQDRVPGLALRMHARFLSCRSSRCFHGF